MMYWTYELDDDLSPVSMAKRCGMTLSILLPILLLIAPLAISSTAHSDDCIPVDPADSEPDEEDAPPGFVDFNVCEGVHNLDPGEDFLLAVHVAGPGSSYATHETWLLESSDGITWSIVPGFEGFLGSVPEVITRDSEILLFNPGKMRAYDMHSGEVRGASVQIKDSDGEPVSYVDPSAILDPEGRIVLFFLNSTGTPMGQDPAAGSNPKDFDSAVEVEGSAGTEFILTEGHRVQVQGSDPDIFFDGNHFVLYISRGQSTLAFASDTLEGDYLPVSGLGEDPFLTREGGIPAGHYDDETANYWTYVHAHSQTGTVVRLAVHESLADEILEEAFDTILSGQTLGYDTDHGVESPSFTENTLVPEPEANLAGLAVLLALAGYSQGRRSSKH